MKKVLITGAKGIIGSVLVKRLKGYYLTLMDLPDGDVTDYEKVLTIFPGHDVVIHLAWDTEAENCRNNQRDPKHTIMYRNVFRAALVCKVPRVIMASSVHADNFKQWEGPSLVQVDRKPTPITPYGEGKVEMEALGKAYAAKGMEVICVRFGGVHPKVSTSKNTAQTGLTYNDLVSMMQHCIDAKTVPNNFVVFYGVSNNKKRIHDTSNPFGWEPREDAEEFYRTNH
jgi:nucleoside-diphosphate-sugar epimerase